MRGMLRPWLDRMRYRLWLLRDRVKQRLFGKRHHQPVFRRIYAANLWGDRESVSGRGSGEAATTVVRAELPALLREYRISRLLDAPCGDFQWMRDIADAVPEYVGVDIVPELIDKNRRAYGTDRITFFCADIAAGPLPPADLVLCRDCFIHLPTRLIHRALGNFRATGARFLLLSNERNVEPYHDIPVGSFRRLNMTLPPFSFPRPLHVIHESAFAGRELCLWEFSGIP